MTLLYLFIGDSAAPQWMRRLAAATHWDTWSGPMVMSAALLSGVGAGWLLLHLSRPRMAAGQVWESRRRDLTGLTIGIVSAAPDRIIAVVLTAPRDPRFDGIAGLHIDLARRGRWVPDWRLVAVPVEEIGYRPR